MQIELSERSQKIKELVGGLGCMGTFGLVELELIEFEKEIQSLKADRKLLNAIVFEYQEKMGNWFYVCAASPCASSGRHLVALEKAIEAKQG